MRLQIGFATHQGRVRTSNQDSVAVVEPRRALFGRPGLWLFVVADGMGGHHGGEVASDIAVRTMVRIFGPQSQRGQPGEALKTALLAANQAIIEKAARAPDLGKMGTTVVAATATDRMLHVCNVGDSRAYLACDEDIRQITQDHSLVEEQIRAGLITEDDPNAKRNILTRAVGRIAPLEVDLFEEAWQPGDELLLCSDGLWGVVSNAQIAAVLADLDPQPATEKLVQMAMTGQSADNISVVVVKRLE